MISLAEVIALVVTRNMVPELCVMLTCMKIDSWVGLASDVKLERF